MSKQMIAITEMPLWRAWKSFLRLLKPDSQKNLNASSENREKNKACSSFDFLKGRTSAESFDGALMKCTNPTKIESERGRRRRRRWSQMARKTCTRLQKIERRTKLVLHPTFWRVVQVQSRLIVRWSDHPQAKGGDDDDEARWKEKRVRVFRKSIEEQSLFFNRFSEGSYRTTVQSRLMVRWRVYEPNKKRKRRRERRRRRPTKSRMFCGWIDWGAKSARWCQIDDPRKTFARNRYTVQSTT